MKKIPQRQSMLPNIGSGFGVVPVEDSRCQDATCAAEMFQAGLDLGITSKQGKRPYQEDEYACKAFISSGGNGPETHFFGLFDGHAGGRCSKFLATSMVQTLVEDPQFDSNLPQSLKRSFHTANENFLRIADRMRLQDGSTGICVVVRERKYLIANVGDCRAILVSDGKPIQLSKDQKPTIPEEQKRIYALGGTVVNCMGIVRVNGVLAVSRAFGNRGLRDVIRPDAEITQRSVTPEDNYLVLASDGLWDVLSNTHVADLCMRYGCSHSAAEIAEELVNHAMAKGSMDNVTCICVKLNNFPERVLNEDIHTVTGPQEARRSTGGYSRVEYKVGGVAGGGAVGDYTDPSHAYTAAPKRVAHTIGYRPLTTQMEGGRRQGPSPTNNSTSPHTWAQQDSLQEHVSGVGGAGGWQYYGLQVLATSTSPTEQSNRFMAAFKTYHSERAKEGQHKGVNDNPTPLYSSRFDPIQSSRGISSQRSIRPMSQGGAPSSYATGGAGVSASVSLLSFQSISGEPMALHETLVAPNTRLLHSPITTRAQNTMFSGGNRAGTANSISRRTTIKRGNR